MPVSVVVGGQFGSEGKGKVALELARLRGASAAVRVGGPNSGHTVIDSRGRTHMFRHLPTAALLPDVMCVIPSGSYVDAELLLREVMVAGLEPWRLLIDASAVIIEPQHRAREKELRLQERIGSTLSGTGAAVAARVNRDPNLRFARDEPRLEPFVRPAIAWMRSVLAEGSRIIIEGTQGYGLSLLHSGQFPHVTSRDTTAAAFVAEAGLSPIDVDEIVLVIRAFPIRVPGDSGELPHEVDWPTITRESGSPSPLIERTSVTDRVRRVARFDPRIVRAAIEVNRPTSVILNHVDYVDARCHGSQTVTAKAGDFIQEIAEQIKCKIDAVGCGPNSVISMA